MYLLLDNPDIDDNSIREIILGPDFPTGGLVYWNGVKTSFENGRGSIVLEGVTNIENTSKDRVAIVIKEIPIK